MRRSALPTHLPGADAHVVEGREADDAAVEKAEKAAQAKHTTDEAPLPKAPRQGNSQRGLPDLEVCKQMAEQTNTIPLFPC